MRTLLPASAVSTSAFVLSALLGTASATTIGFTSQIVDYDVQDTGTYRIEASGAEGGTEPHSGGEASTGGYGADVSGDFKLTVNDVLRIAVGGKGGDGPSSIFVDGAGGGGGGTFVIGPNNTPLLIAGGGGGGGAGDKQGGLSPDGLAARDGISGGAAGTNGSGGLGGTSGAYPGGGGGGFSGKGSDGRGSGGTNSGDRNGAGGNSFANGLGGGGSGTQGGGGFGGGGAGNQDGGGGGGGGGYSGGGGGGYDDRTLLPDLGYGGGGGGSFIAPNGMNGTFDGRLLEALPVTASTGGLLLGDADLASAAANADGNGYVILTDLGPAPVSEPASLALFGTGALSLLTLRRARRR